MSIPDHFLEQLRARLPLSKVVGRHVALVRKGRDHLGLCPFHGEKTPSFKVDDQKGFYHCFGCGAHGTIYSFEMQIAGVSFPEAVERLAAEAGMEVPKQTVKERETAKKKASARDVMEKATVFYERALRMPGGAEALAYLRSRGLNDEVITRFRLGYAPPGGALKGALKHDDIPESLMIDLGLVGVPRDGSSGGTYDVFRNRILFPILDTAGRPIAFGGRALGDGQPKYLNSPETAWFQKGRTLYNLANAREAARKTGKIIVAEGYMDVIALTRAGLPGAVAPLGTALTEDQMTLLWGSTREPVLCFDGDSAGQKAAQRALNKALPLVGSERSLRFALLPAGLDPDDLVGRPGGTDTLHRLLDQALPLSDMAWHSLMEGRSLRSAEDRAALEAEIDAFTARISETVLRSHIRRDLKDRFWQTLREARSLDTTRSAPNLRKGKKPTDPAQIAPPPPPRSPRLARERQMLGLLIAHPDLFDHVAERIGTLTCVDRSLDNLRQVIVMLLSSGKPLDSSSLRDHLSVSGHAREVAALVREATVLAGRSMAADADPSWVRYDWDSAYKMHYRPDLHQDVHTQTERLKEDLEKDSLQPEGLDRLQAIRKEDAAVLSQEFRDPDPPGDTRS